jgi:hypothetical protein
MRTSRGLARGLVGTPSINSGVSTEDGRLFQLHKLPLHPSPITNSQESLQNAHGPSVCTTPHPSSNNQTIKQSKHIILPWNMTNYVKTMYHTHY